MNVIWLLIICITVLYCLCNGRVDVINAVFVSVGKETFDFVVKTSGKHEFLGEQVDNNTLRPNWVIGLGWSHAMFVIALEALMNNKIM